jgi:hypothetical protein
LHAFFIVLFIVLLLFPLFALLASLCTHSPPPPERVSCSHRGALLAQILHAALAADGGVALDTAAWRALVAVLLLLAPRERLASVHSDLARVLDSPPAGAPARRGSRSEAVLHRATSPRDGDASAAARLASACSADAERDVVLRAVSAALLRRERGSERGEAEGEAETDADGEVRSALWRALLEALMIAQRSEWAIALVCGVARRALTAPDVAALRARAERDARVDDVSSAKLSLALGARTVRVATALFDNQLVALTLAYADMRRLVEGDADADADAFLASGGGEADAAGGGAFLALARFVVSAHRSRERGASPAFAASLAHLVARLVIARCCEHAGALVMHARRVHARLRTESASRFALSAFLEGYAAEEGERSALRRGVCAAALRVLEERAE